LAGTLLQSPDPTGELAVLPDTARFQGAALGQEMVGERIRRERKK